jgi:hypothetical protein
MCCRGQQRLLFYTIDADQTFGVDVQTAEGPRSVQALNYFYWIDRLFDTGSVEVMTGKVVGDPPVSPAGMTGSFLENVLCFLRGMTGLDPGAAYRQPSDDTLRADDAAYHDMAQLFGFTGQSAAYHYRCRKKGEPSNVDCFIEFARQLNSFLHGEHPTRATWFRYQSAPTSLHPARTVYTGNYVFNAAALRWFIPFAPLRLRMSGPTLGRMLKAELGAGFAAVNLPMQHGRTLAPATSSTRDWPRPGHCSASTPRPRCCKTGSVRSYSRHSAARSSTSTAAARSRTSPGSAAQAICMCSPTWSTWNRCGQMVKTGCS